MGEYCARCDKYVAITDPHGDCTGPPWLIGHPIPGCDEKRVVLNGLKPDVEAVIARLKQNAAVDAAIRRYIQAADASVWECNYVSSDYRPALAALRSVLRHSEGDG